MHKNVKCSTYPCIALRSGDRAGPHHLTVGVSHVKSFGAARLANDTILICSTCCSSNQRHLFKVRATCTLVYWHRNAHVCHVRLDVFSCGRKEKSAVKTPYADDFAYRRCFAPYSLAHDIAYSMTRMHHCEGVLP